MIRFRSSLFVGAALLFWAIALTGWLFAPRFWALLSPRKSITICTWPLVFDPNYLQAFEQETGITLYITYFETNEELYGKITASGGEGYDLLVPTDYMVNRLRREGLLKKLDQGKMDFVDRLKPRLRGNYYDPNNEYTVGYFWGIYGVAINKLFFPQMPEASWKLIFEPDQIVAPIAMTDAPREAILLAAQYLFGSIDALSDPEKVRQARQLLIDQKQDVLLYNEARTEDLLLGNNCSTVAALSPDVRRVLQEEGAADKIAFLVPKEGTFLFVDGFVIPKRSNKEDLVYQFLNFMYRKEVVEHHLHAFGSCSPVTDVTISLEQDPCDESNLISTDFFREVLSSTEIDAIWVDLMAH